ncbi:hypothetical protein [Kitasatospora sp. GAS1066B]|uniref:hypothetical protein n=1 Tax=Kitasatospora sp. GAS1066B TaxID=3156271 RepID=UPI003517C196
MLSARTRRATAAGATALTALLTAGLTALPAHADSGQLQLFVPGSVQVPMTAPADPASDPNSMVLVNVGRTGTDTVHNAQVAFDTSGLANVAAFHVQDNPGTPCSTKATVVTCAAGDLSYPSINITEHFWLTAATGVKPGTSGVLHVTESAPGMTSVSHDVKVSAGGPDLKVKDLGQVTHAKPGGTLSPVIEVANLGQLPTTKLVVEMTATDGLELKQRAANCEYADRKEIVYSGPGAPANQNRPAATDVICYVDATVAPGEVYKIDPIQFGVSPTAYATFSDIEVFTSEDAPFSQAPQWRANESFRAGTSAPLMAAKTVDAALLSAPRHTYDNQAHLEVAVDNTADFVALGNWAPQAGGKQGTLSVGLRNDGPASIIYGRSGEDAADIRVVLPQGVTATKVPSGCLQPSPKDAPSTYRCETSYMIVVGNKISYDFGLQVDDPTAVPNAQISLVSSEDPSAKLAFDPNAANNTLQVALGAQPTTTPSTAPATATTQAAATAGPATATKAAGQDLAFTGGGSNSGTIAAVGAGVVVLGAGALVYANRRRKAATHN